MFKIFHYLQVIAQERSFSKAAAKLYISQSSLSLTIQRFENSLGVQIFDRSKNPIGLTDAGETILYFAEQILAVERNLQAFVAEYNNLEKGNVRVGVPHLFTMHLMPKVISDFLAQRPNVVINMMEADYPALHQAVLENRVDFFVDSCIAEDPKLFYVPLAEEHLLLAVPRKYPINEELKHCRLDKQDIFQNKHLDAEVPAVKIAVFKDLPVLMLERGNDLYDRFSQLCSTGDSAPEIGMYLHELTTAYGMADAQLGFTLTTDTVIRTEERGDNLFFYKPDDLNMTRNIQIVTKKNHYCSHLCHAFMEQIKQEAARQWGIQQPALAAD